MSIYKNAALAIVNSYIFSVLGISIGDDLYAWLAVFVLPVNSALNPILYTVTTKMFRQQVLIISFLVYAS